eukprot:5976963-Prymnesium_polylepis.1
MPSMLMPVPRRLIALASPASRQPSHASPARSPFSSFFSRAIHHSALFAAQHARAHQLLDRVARLD